MKYYSAILLAVMVLNIGKYRLPHIEYSLFKDYIAENLCVKRNETDNTCRGKCHLEKQIKRVSETDEQPDNPTGLKQVEAPADDYVVTKELLQDFHSFAGKKLSVFACTCIVKICTDIPDPPPKRSI